MKLQIVILVALVSLSLCIDERELGFTKIGTHKGVDAAGQQYQKSFYLTRDFSGSYMMAKLFCLAYGMELARFETHEEFNTADKIFRETSFVMGDGIFVDGVTLTTGSQTEWFFSNGKKLPQPIKWNPGEPNAWASERCIALRVPNGLGYTDYPCNAGNNRFICQQYDSSS